MKFQTKYFSLCLVLLLLTLPSTAKIVRLVITKSEAYNGGRIYGNAGQYERIYGQAFGEVDPAGPMNAVIQDIGLAPLNARGMVEYISDFILLRPGRLSDSNRVLFVSLPNRGNAFSVDSALMLRGYIFLWAAWQGDVLEGGNRLLMKIPVAKDHGRDIIGKVRAELQVTTPAKTLDLGSGYFSGSTHHSYETVNLDNAGLVLTKRVHESDPRQKIPNSQWAFSDCSLLPFPGTPVPTRISLKDGFDPDYIYELVYTAKDPLVLGLGFAAIRDIASFMRYTLKDEAGTANPVLIQQPDHIPIRAAIMQGVSQCGNFTRSFLQLGFNQDEDGKMVFDGVNTHIATRRVSLNVRFGRPGGGGTQHEDHLFPSNEPPYTWDKTYDPVSHITGGILESCLKENNCPKIMQTLSSTEYWQLRASLRTTDPYGKTDLPIPPGVRIYMFAGTQHSPSGSFDRMSGRPGNHNPYAPVLRALLVALEDWILEGKEPPPSCYPMISKKTLVRPDKEIIGWPRIPGVVYNGRLNEGSLISFGPGYNMKNSTGIIQEPVTLVKGKKYTVLVPKVDIDGNESGGIRNINVRVPVGTYTGWSLRVKGYGEGDLAALSGMFIPFKATKAERLKAGDPRLSLEERYATREAYASAVRKAAKELVSEGFLLAEDEEREIGRAVGSFEY